VIENLADVSGAELVKQIEYLQASPVAWATELVKKRTHILRAGTIRTCGSLGDQVTIFENLGGVLAKNQVGMQRFLVRHVWDALMDARSTDVKSREQMKAIYQTLVAGAMTPNVTLIRDAGDIVIDGNKTAAAFHQLHKDDKTTDLRVFILVPR
jgi:hypothetical protein